MRNLKKVLALVLALVMSLSLVTIANAADFSDNADIDYSEAVDVMVAAGIIDGVGNNSFDPNGTLTREQAAKLITYMLLGENSEKLGVEGTSFNDVAATRWSAPAIEYCASLGIIDGAGDGNFYPAGKLTGYAFAKMLLTAIGYDSQLEGFTGAGWTIPVASIGMEVGLDNGLEKMFGSAEISRQEAAQMALNAIKTPLVEYNKQATISVNGAEVSLGDKEASYVTTTIARTQTISKQKLSNSNDYTIEFGEKYLPKLELQTDVDDFGRPSYTWAYDKKVIGTYLDDTDLVAEFTTKVTGKDLYDAITKNVMEHLEDDVLTVYIDGETKVENNPAVFTHSVVERTNNDGVGATEKGVLTQVFVTRIEGENETEYDVKIVIINTYLAIATEDYDTKNEEVDIEIYAIDNFGTSKNPDFIKATDQEKDTATVKNDDINVENVKEDDKYLVTVAAGKVQTMVAPEIVADASIDSFKLHKDVTVEGTTYEYAHTAKYDVEVLDDYSKTNLKDTTYNVILDPYGYLIGIEQNTEADQYVFLTGMEGNTSDLSTKNADANVIFLDGRMETISVNVGKSKFLAGTQNGPHMNTWCTYSVDNAGVYTLKQVSTDVGDKIKVMQSAIDADDYSGEIKIDKKNVALTGIGTAKVYGNNDTIYLAVSTAPIKSATLAAADPTQPWAAVIDDVDSVTVGARNASLVAKDQVAGDGSNKEDTETTPGTPDGDGPVPSDHEVYPLFKDNGYIIAAVVIGEDDGVSKTYAYVHTEDVKRESYNKADDEWTWTREAIVDGKIVDLTESGSTIKYLNKMAPNNWYEVKYDAKGNVRGIKNNGGTNGAVDFTDAVGKYPSKVDKVEKSVDANDTVLMMVDYHSTKGLMTYKAAGTLYTAKGPSEGFSVSPDVKTVVCLSAKDKNGNVEMFDDVTDGYTGYTGLEKAIRDLDDNFKGWLSVLFEDGVATVIIFNDYTGSTVDTGSDTTVDNRITDAEYDGRETVTIYYTGNTPNNMQIQRSIIDAIKEFEGVESVKGVSLDTADGQFDATIVWDDGSENSVVDYSYVLVNDNMSADVIEDIEEALTGNATTPYTFIGDITVKGNEITFKASAYSDKAKAMRDLARFLGAAHTELKVNSIAFNDVDYKWDDDAVGGDGQPVLGSKWHKAADDEYCDTAGGGKTKNTLIGDIVTYANNSLGSLQIELDGVEYTFTFAES